MALSVADRKHLMPFGAQKEVALEESVAQSYVSAVMSNEVRPKTEHSRKRLRRVQVAIARKLRMRVDEVFGDDNAANHEAVAAA